MATVLTYSIGIDGGTYDYASLSAFFSAHSGTDTVTADEFIWGQAEGAHATADTSGGYVGFGAQSALQGSCGIGVRADSANTQDGAYNTAKYRVTGDLNMIACSNLQFKGVQLKVLRCMFGGSAWADRCIVNNPYTEAFDQAGTGEMIASNCFIEGKARNASGGTMILRATSVLGSIYDSGSDTECTNVIAYEPGGYTCFDGTFTGSNNASRDSTAPGSGSITGISNPFVGSGSLLTDAADANGLTGAGYASLAGLGAEYAFDGIGQACTDPRTIGAHELDPVGGGGGDVKVNATGSSVTLIGASGQAAFASSIPATGSESSLATSPGQAAYSVSIPATGSAGGLSAADGTVGVALGFAALSSAVALAVAAGIATFSALFGSTGSSATLTASAGQCTYASALTCTGSGATLTCSAGQAQYSSGDGSVNVTATGSACTLTASAGQCTYGAAFAATGGGAALTSDSGTVAYAAFFGATGSQATLTVSAGTTLYSLLLQAVGSVRSLITAAGQAFFGSAPDPVTVTYGDPVASAQPITYATPIASTQPITYGSPI